MMKPEGIAISMQGLTKKFGDLLAVNRVDLNIKKGELFGLLGPNGAGKSTIIKMLTTMLAPSEGIAKVWDHDIAEERNAVRSSIGVVFQDPAVDGMLTGRENLDFHGRMYGLGRALRRDRIEEVLRLVDLADKQQMILITHWPQLARLAKRHFLVRKDVIDGLTYTGCVRLGAAEIEAELTRMSGGESA